MSTTLDRVKALERRVDAIEMRLVADGTLTAARLTALEQSGPVADLAAIEARLTALETQLDPATGNILRDRET